MASDLILDTAIRDLVLIPIFVVMFLVGILRHNITVIMQAEKKKTKEQMMDAQVLLRSRMLRSNSAFIPARGFYSRKQYFNNKDSGMLVVTGKDRGGAPNPMSDPSMMTDMMKGNMGFMVPQMLIMGWINYFFSGFLTTRVPFPLTVRFKPMLQRGVELPELEASWISSLSWYFLNMFGLRGLHTIVLGANQPDETQMMQQQMGMGASPAAPPDPSKLYQNERESLEIVSHEFALDDIEEHLMKTFIL
eukprot:Nk52_evm85s215 gene=Nk52_evmTU85s215